MHFFGGHTFPCRSLPLSTTALIRDSNLWIIIHLQRLGHKLLPMPLQSSHVDYIYSKNVNAISMELLKLTPGSKKKTLTESLFNEKLNLNFSSADVKGGGMCYCIIIHMIKCL